MLGPGASWQGGPGGDTQGGKIRPVSQEVSVFRYRTQLLGRGTESDFPLHMRWGGGTAADLFLFTEHAPCPQSHLTTLTGLPVSITETHGNGP